MAQKDQSAVIGLAVAVPKVQAALTAAPTAVGAFTAAPADAPVGGTGMTAGAYDTAANRDIMINSVNVNIDRIAELETEVLKLDDMNSRMAEMETILEKIGLLPGT